MTFSEALQAIKQGKKVTRHRWKSGDKKHIKINRGTLDRDFFEMAGPNAGAVLFGGIPIKLFDETTTLENRAPSIVIMIKGKLKDWKCTMKDLLAEDWIIL